MGFAAYQRHQLVIIQLFHCDAGQGKPTSMNFSRFSSRLARSSLRFLFSAMRACFLLSNTCLCCSSASRSECSWSMRAVIRLFSSSLVCSGCCSRNSSTGIMGSFWYLWLDIAWSANLQNVLVEERRKENRPLERTHVRERTRKTRMLRSLLSDAAPRSTGSAIAGEAYRFLAALQL